MNVASPFIPPSTADAPFACPDIVVDLPVPPSTNKARKIDWSAYPRIKDWHKHCDNLLIYSKQVRGRKRIDGPFELQIIVDENKTGCDLGNIEKLATDYLVRIELIKDDSMKHLRRLVMEPGFAPQGIRMIVKPMGDDQCK